MKMASSSMLGIVLAVTFFGAGVVTDRLTNVNIMNFPLDELGNLKIKVAEKPLQIHKDSVEITVLDLAKGRLDFGAKIEENVRNATLPFAFSPKETFLNVTDLWITVVAFAPLNRDAHFDITVNDATTTSTVTRFDPSYPMPVSTHIGRILYETIRYGNNIIVISNPEDWDSSQWIPTALWLFKVTIFIEYEYKA